jgi:hypothetical protein
VRHIALHFDTIKRSDVNEQRHVFLRHHHYSHSTKAIQILLQNSIRSGEDSAPVSAQIMKEESVYYQLSC